MKRIAIEEHFSTKEHLEQLGLILRKEYPIREIVEAEEQLHVELRWLSTPPSPLTGGLPLADRIVEIGEQRIKDMEEAGIDMQILSSFLRVFRHLTLLPQRVWPKKSMTGFIK